MRPDSWIKKFGLRNFLRWLLMDCLELFPFLRTDVCLQCRHVMLQLDCLASLYVNCSTLCIQDHWCRPEHHNLLLAKLVKSLEY